MKYLLACSCGQQHAIETSQAGTSLHCACGQELLVPTMLAIKGLPLADAGRPEPPARGPRKWSLLQGSLFAGGLFLAAAALVFAGLARLPLQQMDPSLNTQTVDTELARQIDSFSPADTLQLWQLFESAGLGPQTPPTHVVVERQARLYHRISLLSLGVSAIGLALALLSLWLPGRNSPGAPVTRRRST